MTGQKQDDRHEHTFSSLERIRDVALKTGRSGERGSGISVLAARHDDDDNDDDDSYFHCLFDGVRFSYSQDLGYNQACSVFQSPVLFLSVTISAKPTELGLSLCKYYKTFNSSEYFYNIQYRIRQLIIIMEH